VTRTARRARRAVASALLCTAILAAGAASAATQTTTPAPPPPPAREGSAEFAFVSTTGNTSTQTIGVAGEVIARPDAWTLRSKSAYVQNEADDELKARSFTTLFRASREVRPRLSFYGQYDYLRNAFAGILHRNAVEAGSSWQAIEPARQALRFDVGAGYAHERRVVGNAQSNAVLTFGAAYKLTLSTSAEVSDDARTILSLQDGEEWRAENVAAVTAKLTTLFSLKVSNTVRFVNQPTLGFEQTDTVTAVALVAKF
jgi:putative salt-induced outer membrane protein YdiY